MKILKILAGIIISVVVLVLIAVTLVVLLFDPNDFKPEISKMVKDATQRDLVMAGDIKWSFYPTLGVSVQEVSLSNPPDFPADNATFAEMQTAQVEVRLLSLLQEQIEIGTVVLHDAQLHLIRTADGKTNWEDLMPAATDQPSEAPPPEQAPMVLPSIAGVDLRNATVVWDDQQLGQQFTLSEISLSTSALAENVPIDVNAYTAFSSNLLPDTQASLTIATTTQLNPAAQLFEFQPLQLTLLAKGDAIPEGSQEIKLNTSLAVNLATQQLEVGELLVNAFATTLTGQVNVSDLNTAPSVTGQLQLAETDLRKILTMLGQAPNTADPEVLKKLSFDSTFSATTQSVKLEPLALALDDTQLRGQFQVKDFTTAATELALQVDEIDLDRYLPPTAAQPPLPPKPSTEPPADQPATAPTELPLDLIKTLQLNGTILVDRLKVSNFRIQDAKLAVTADNGIVNITPQANFYQGSYQGLIQLDANPQPPVFQLNNDLQGVQTGDMLKDLTGADTLIGLATFTTQLHADATSIESIQNSLTGTVDFGIDNGAIKGFNLGRVIRDAQALLGMAEAVAEELPAQTDFSSMGGTIIAEQGVLSTENLGIKSPLFRAEGKGSLQLANKGLDFLLRAGIVSTSKGQEGGSLDDLYGLVIPLKITGSVHNPKIEPTLEGLLTGRAKQKIGEVVQEKAGELLEEHSDKLEGVSDLLKDLPSIFGR